MRSYLLTLLSFKAAIGSLLVVGGWDSLELSSDPTVTLLIVTILTFLPAGFARPLSNSILKHRCRTILPMLFIGVIALVICLERIRGVFSTQYFMIYAVVWTGIFVIENLMDYWLMKIAAQSVEVSSVVNRYSMFLLQIGTILGPLFVAIFTDVGVSGWQIATVFLAIALITSVRFRVGAENDRSPTASTNHDSGERGKSVFVISIGMIWVVIAAVNYMIPWVVSRFLNGSLKEISIIEIAFGLSMGISPFIFRSAKIRSLPIAPILILLVPLSMIFFRTNLLGILLIQVTSFGLLFGRARVELKIRMASLFTPIAAARIVSLGNAASGPMVSLALFLISIESLKGGEIFLYSFSFSSLCVVGMVTLIIGIKSKGGAKI